ncbi:MAG TPA: hypothetical protein EYP17_11605 [Candidatus Latescibacteria bacterium]|nr:hypothetical protein [Candidatus Latescibacterota bacterium]
MGRIGTVRKGDVSSRVGASIYVGALIFRLPFRAELALFILSYTIVAGDVIWRATRNALHGKFFDENFLQDMALDHSRRSIRSLLAIRPDYANLRIDGGMRAGPVGNDKQDRSSHRSGDQRLR